MQISKISYTCCIPKTVVNKQVTQNKFVNIQKPKFENNQFSANTNYSNISFGAWFFKDKSKPEISSDNSAFASVQNCRNLTPHILCGGLQQTFADFECNGKKKVFSKFKKDGKIDTIIFFGEDFSVTDDMHKAMKKAGLKFFNLNIWTYDNWFKEDEKKITVKSDAVEKLKDFFSLVNSNENILMGCGQGVQRTSQALFFNYFLNKNKQSGKKLVESCVNLRDYVFLDNFMKTEKLFNALSYGQKSDLGISDRKLPKIEYTDLDNAIKTLKNYLVEN